MKSIKQQYIDLREGNMSQAQFMRNIRMNMPQYVTNITSFEDSIKILKNKGILTEADISSGPNAQWLGSIKDIIEDMWQNGKIKTSAEYGSVMTKLSTQPEGIVAQYGETSAEDAANKLLDSVSHLRGEYDPGPGEDEDFERDYDMDYEEPNDFFDMAESLDRTTAEEIATQAGSYEIAVDKLEDMGLTPQAANDIATEMYGKGVSIKEAKYKTYADVVNAISKKYGYKVYHDEIEEFMRDKDSLKAIMAGKDPIVAYEEFYNIQRESLNEAKDEKGKWTNADGKSMYAQFKEINNLNGQEVLIGIDYEMQKNEKLTKQEATKIVIKNLKKNPIYYTAEDMSGVEGYEPEYIGGKSAQPEAHQMQYLDKNMGNVVDKKRGMQPVKDVEKPKKDSDKGGETNKTVKGVSLMSLIAKSVRGLKKMDATGEKMKKITMKEARLNDFSDETPGTIAQQIMNFVDSNPTLKQYSDEIVLQSNPDGFLKFGYWEELPSDVAKALSLQFNIQPDFIDADEDTSGGTFYRLTPKHKMGSVDLGSVRERLKEMIRKQLKEMADGMEPMSREDGSFNTNEQ